MKCPRCKNDSAIIRECEDDPRHRREVYCLACGFWEFLARLNKKAKSIA